MVTRYGMKERAANPYVFALKCAKVDRFSKWHKCHQVLIGFRFLQAVVVTTIYAKRLV